MEERSLRRLATIALVFLLAFFWEFQLVACHGGGGGDDDGGGEEHHGNLRNRGLILTKVWCLIIAFVATFVAGISPYFVRWNQALLLLGTQFAGGVFLGTALMHFLADSSETFRDLTKKTYPFAFMLATAGYLITLLGDCIISIVYRRYEAESKGSRGGGEADVENAIGSKHHQEGNGIVGASAVVKEASFGDSLLLILALCFHSVFEGIAIGVSATEKDAWRNLWTICLHKLFAAIAMGIALLNILPNRPLLSTSLYSFAFAISTPIGVAIGIIIDSTTQGSAADWTYAVSMGVATGVFIYVAINHLLAKGFQNRVTGSMLKFLAVLAGAGVIAVVMIWD